MNIKVSVIVPVYNAEKFLDRCITSVLSQSLENIEIIVINDKSTDKSKNIILKYKNLYKNITFLDNDKNEGVSSARNNAISLCRGKYIMFIDSDDWIESDMIETLYNEAEKNDLDIAICNHFVEGDNGGNRELRRINLSTDLIYNGIDMIKEIMTAENNMQGFIWNKIIKSELFSLNKLKFNENLKYLEDLELNIKLFSNCKRVKVIDKPLYHYIQREGSITKTFSKKYICGIEVLKLDIKNYLNLKSINLDKEYKVFVTRSIIVFILNITESSSKNKNQLISEIFKIEDNRKCIIECNKGSLKGYEQKICRLLILFNFNSTLFLLSYRSLIKIKSYFNI